MSSLFIANLRSPESPVTRCRVCGFAELRTDEVAERDLLLAECPRCEHRFTGHVRPAVSGPTRVPAFASVEEAATAA